eukprot:COSAG02_NODE_6086_length_3813_cov_3.395261_1_plen_339_part_00
MDAGTLVWLKGMNTAKFNRHLAVVLPTRVEEDTRTVVQLLTTDHVPAGQLQTRPSAAPRPMSVRTGCLQAAWPCDQRRLLQYGCAHERVILRSLQQCGLPPECAAAVLSYLEISPVIPSHVTAVACSSESQGGGAGYTFSKEASLQPGDADCWISAQNVALHDDQDYAELLAEDPEAPQFDEWLVYSLTSKQSNLEGSLPVSRDYAEPEPSPPGAAGPSEAVTPLVWGNGRCRCQVHRVSIRIPVLPHGPLSVRRFYLQAGNTKSAMGFGQRIWEKDQADPVTLETTAAGETDWGTRIQSHLRPHLTLALVVLGLHPSTLTHTAHGHTCPFADFEIVG